MKDRRLSAGFFLARAAERFIRPDERYFFQSPVRKSLFILLASQDILDFATDRRPVRRFSFACPPGIRRDATDVSVGGA
jgi:hypothetical protein